MILIVGVIFWQAYLFNDYWEDIGTIKSFFDANLALAAQVVHLIIEILRVINAPSFPTSVVLMLAV